MRRVRNRSKFRKLNREFQLEIDASEVNTIFGLLRALGRVLALNDCVDFDNGAFAQILEVNKGAQLVLE